MKTRPNHAVLAISIDVAGDPSPTPTDSGWTTAEPRAVLDATKWLLRTLDQFRLPATWFFAGPGTSVLRSHVVAAEMRHEIGLLVAENGPQSRERFEFSRNLERRLLAARAAGVEISSLATRSARRIEHLDLLVKHGIRATRQSALCSGSNGVKRSGWAAVSTLRFGISNLPATLRASEAAPWQSWIRGWEDRRHIVAAADRRQYCHMAFDIHLLSNASARKRLQASLRTAARLFHGPDSRVETISSVAATLMARPSAPSAHSILRAA